MTIDVYVEAGAKRVFAGAIEWPGWCRSAKTEDDAIEALFAYAPRYAKVVARRRLGFEPPPSSTALRVRERVDGNATTDFGAPAVAPNADDRRFDEADAQRLVSILKACWRAFDTAATSAAGRELSKGPRGGGRDVDRMTAHIREAEGGYLSALGSRPPERERVVRAMIERVLISRARGEPPERVPRSGKLWSPRYFVRRTAWHAVDHAWEIEDRLRPNA